MCCSCVIKYCNGPNMPRDSVSCLLLHVISPSLLSTNKAKWQHFKSKVGFARWESKKRWSVQEWDISLICRLSTGNELRRISTNIVRQGRLHYLSDVERIHREFNLALPEGQDDNRHGWFEGSPACSRIGGFIGKGARVQKVMKWGTWGHKRHYLSWYVVPLQANLSQLCVWKQLRQR